MRLAILALAGLLLAAPALAATAPFHLVRAAAGDDCGIASVPAGKAAGGLNCGNGSLTWSMRCMATQGGWNCNATWYGEVGISRWINAGSASFAISGDCATSAGLAWGAAGGAAPAAASAECHKEFFWSAGTCRTFSGAYAAAFGGNDAPMLPARTLSFPMCR